MMKAPRFSIRVAMAGMVVVALLASLWARDLSARRRDYLKSAAYHAGREAEELRNVASIEKGRRAGEPGINDRSILLVEKAAHLRVAYHAESRRKYEIAASRPWGASPRISRDPGEALVWESLMKR